MPLVAGGPRRRPARRVRPPPAGLRGAPRLPARCGQMMAGAFENALLMERLEESNQTLALLVESGIEFGATLEQDDVLAERRAPTLCAATDAPNCDIFTLHGRRVPLRRLRRPRRRRTPSTSAPSTRSTDLRTRPLALESRAARVRRGHRRGPARQRLERRRTSAGGIAPCCACLSISRGRGDRHRRRSTTTMPRRFERTDFLHSLAQVAAGALANATLFDELDRSAERMALVGDVSFELSSSLDLGRGAALHGQTALRDARARPCATSTPCGTARWLESVISIDDGRGRRRLAGPRVPARRLDGHAQGRRVA